MENLCWEQQNPDRLSELPEPLLQQILCQLELKQQAQTSILARQWRYTWTGVRILRIDQRQFNERDDQYGEDQKSKRFIRAIDCIMSHDSVIDKLDLAISTSCDDYTVSRWILLAIRRNVREVKLSIVKEGNGPYTFPVPLFFCKALRSLRVESFSVETLPVFASLESLTFVRVHFGDHPYVNMLFSCFPRLRKLTMSYCEEAIRVTIKSPTLRFLKIEGSFGSERLSIVAPELEELSFERWSGLKIEKDTPKLQLLKWIDSGYIGTNSFVDRTSFVLHFGKFFMP